VISTWSCRLCPALVIELFEVTKGFPRVFLMDLSDDNHGTDCDASKNERTTDEPCHGYSGRLLVIPVQNAEYDDIEVIVSGTHVSEQERKLEPFDVRERFAYRGGKYERQ
jgi:hypothetical protein